MRALTVRPGEAGSARLAALPEPASDQGRVLVRTLLLGVCGTDREISGGSYGEAPPGRDRLILPDLAALRPDIVIECTGAPVLMRALLGRTGPAGILCLAGLSSGGRELPVDLGGLNRRLVLANEVIFGTVNANRRHYEAAAAALAKAERAWLGRLITRRVALPQWPRALERRPDDVKTVLDFRV